jgi:hypothetical protein
MRWFSAWSIWNLRTQDVLRVALLLAIVALVPGWFYWRSTGAKLAHCLYGDSSCSSALATYLLCALSLLAFCAAFEAVKHAYRSLQESTRAAKAAMQSARVATRAATDEETSHLAGSGCYDAQCPEARPGVCKDIYIDNLSSDPTVGLPPGCSNEDFLSPIKLDIVCLGRAPAINANLWLVTRSDGAVSQGKVSIGTIETNKRRHLNMKLPGFRGHFPLCGEGSTNGQETSSCLSLGVPG